MLWLTVNGVKPYDGRYEFDLEQAEFTTREWGWIKRHSGYLPLTVEDGFMGGDPELFAVFAAIALRRASKITNEQIPEVVERIADAPFGTTIQLEDDQPETVEDDAGPPVSSSNGSSGSSGDGSTTSSAPSAPGPRFSGTHGSATSESDRLRSVT